MLNTIKYEGSYSELVCKYEKEDFSYGSQLIVHESQEALFFKNGQALDLFSAGRYTLNLEKLPILNKIFSLPTDEEAFHTEIYFINLVTQRGIKWGTSSKIRLIEPNTGIPLEIGACGEFNIKIIDSRKIVLKLVGTLDIMDKSDLDFFRAMIMTFVKSYLAKTIKENNINILEIDENLETISSGLKDKINISLEEYGLFMPEFYVTTVLTPDDDPNYKRLKQQHADLYLNIRQEEIKKAEAEASAKRKYVEAETAANLKIIDVKGEAEVIKAKAEAEAAAYKMKAEAEAVEMHVKGFTYAQETAREVGSKFAENSNSTYGGGSFVGDVMGLGVGIGAMGGVLNMTKEAMNNIAQPINSIQENTKHILAEDFWNCDCGQTGLIGNFCNSCGSKKIKEPNTWNCGCGAVALDGNFCSNCGKKRGE